jgi:hypothetical protein
VSLAQHTRRLVDAQLVFPASSGSVVLGGIR